MTRREFATMGCAVVGASRFRKSPRCHANSRDVYKNPSCTCCEGYAQYLEQNGFKVDVRPTNDLAEISRKAGIPEELEGCHTSFIGNYVRAQNHCLHRTILNGSKTRLIRQPTNEV